MCSGAFRTTLSARRPWKSNPIPFSNTHNNYHATSIRASELSDFDRTAFGGIGRLYSDVSPTSRDQVDDVIRTLKNSHVIVFGLGGVGSWAAEALCRSGVGHLTLIDLDDICQSNLNRQLHATTETIGRLKIDEMKKRLESIHPGCNITLVHDFISPDNVHEILHFIFGTEGTAGGTTMGELKQKIILDAIDGSKEKSALLAACADLSIPVVTCGGSAGKKDPTKIVYEDLIYIKGDKLLSTCRKSLRKHYGFAEGLPHHQRMKLKKKEKPWHITAVYSMEEQKALAAGDDASSLRRCDGALGTAVFVTGTVGFTAAARVIDMLVNDQLSPPRRS